MNRSKPSKNFAYEVEVSGSDSKHEEEFALELFEIMEDATQTRPVKKVQSFDEFVQWMEEE